MTSTVVAPSGGAPSQLIAREIRAELARQQLSNRRLALALGVSSMWVNRRISACETEITVEDVQRIAEALNVPVQRLVSAWLPRLDSNQQPAG
ncbi:helix-turn-helix domain-containing protein [Kribbella sp.]|uniref:helix-turn-helix domain-containing protein n=1 Tax=Kribbella sp. TaxID=1871183 RepID=UPI0039C9B04C